MQAITYSERRRLERMLDELELAECIKPATAQAVRSRIKKAHQVYQKRYTTGHPMPVTFAASNDLLE